MKAKELIVKGLIAAVIGLAIAPVYAKTVATTNLGGMHFVLKDGPAIDDAMEKKGYKVGTNNLVGDNTVVGDMVWKKLKNGEVEMITLSHYTANGYKPAENLKPLTFPAKYFDWL